MRKMHASSLIHIVNFIKCLFSTLLHVCLCRVETKSSHLFIIKKIISIIVILIIISQYLSVPH